ncbi:phosphoglucomutase/phosphomannomutase family protein [bacterium]|nr:phosphoglucomutase/phosphomannomutase family protein [bacterium]
MTGIKFGTDGWRAILDKDFTYENVDKVISGIATYIFNDSKYERKILIGYDPRNKADEFASYIAKKLAGYGFNIEISKNIVATPVLAYSALNEKAYAIMLTASHNPPEYLGIKFIPYYGGPAEDYMVEKIVNNLDKDFSPVRTNGTIEETSFEENYIKHIYKLIDIKRIHSSGIEINYDGHHGAAAKLFKRILDENKIKNICQNMKRDINFGGSMPDPKEKYLPELKKLCTENGNIGLSNDGDGDRFGVFDENGIFISANDIISMLLKHLLINKKLTGEIAKTVGASAMLDLYAKKYNIEVIETPVGFKWLGAAMRKENVIIAGEESGGLSIKGHIPEKDGIIANLLIMEMIAYTGKKLFEIHEEFLKELNRKFINERVDIKLDSKEEQDKIIDKFKTYNKIGNYNIVKTNSIDGYKMYLDEGSTILIRKSGTEPLLRIYFETDSDKKISELKTIIQHLV